MFVIAVTVNVGKEFRVASDVTFSFATFVFAHD